MCSFDCGFIVTMSKSIVDYFKNIRYCHLLYIVATNNSSQSSYSGATDQITVQLKTWRKDSLA